MVALLHEVTYDKEQGRYATRQLAVGGSASVGGILQILEEGCNSYSAMILVCRVHQGRLLRTPRVP